MSYVNVLLMCHLIHNDIYQFLYHLLYVYTFSNMRALCLFLISSPILNIIVPWSPYLESKFSETEFQTLKQVAITKDTKSPSCNSRVGGTGDGDFQSI